MLKLYRNGSTRSIVLSDNNKDITNVQMVKCNTIKGFNF